MTYFVLFANLTNFTVNYLTEVYHRKGKCFYLLTGIAHVEIICVAETYRREKIEGKVPYTVIT